jgi:hypothetical protein
MLGAVVCVLTSAYLFFMSTPAHRAAAASPSYIRVIHASPDIGTATVFVDGNMLLNNFQFGTVTPYATVPAGPHKVQVGLIGTGPGAATITQTISVDPGVVYTVAALGTKTDGFKLQIFIDDNTVNSGSAKLRVYHLSPGTGSVSVANGSTTLINSLAYQQASDYLTEPAGTYNLNLDLSSSQNTSLPVSTDLSANTVTSIFAIGLLNGTPKLQTISAQVAGLPNVPGTGSDPTYRAVSDSAQPAIPWLPEIAFVLLVGGFLVYRMRRVRRA